MPLPLWQSIDDVLSFAIQQERDFAKLYQAAAETLADATTAALLHAFAKQEKVHRVRLEELRGVHGMEVTTGDLAALHNQVNPDPPTISNSSLQAIVRYAVKAEADAETLYTWLADMSGDPDIRVVFRTLAQEEHEHAAWFKAEYKRQMRNT